MTSFTRKQGDKRRRARKAPLPPKILRKGHPHRDEKHHVDRPTNRDLLTQAKEELDEERKEYYEAIAEMEEAFGYDPIDDYLSDRLELGDYEPYPYPYEEG